MTRISECLDLQLCFSLANYFCIDVDLANIVFFIMYSFSINLVIRLAQNFHVYFLFSF